MKKNFLKKVNKKVCTESMHKYFVFIVFLKKDENKDWDSCAIEAWTY